jgi:hypothetical protein
MAHRTATLETADELSGDLPGTGVGATAANVTGKIGPTLIAGFAKLVEL